MARRNLVIPGPQPGERERPGRRAGVCFEHDDVDPELCCDSADWRVDGRAHENDAGVQILEVELELGRTVGQLPRRTYPRGRCCDERRRRLRAVLDDQDNAIADADPGAA